MGILSQVWMELLIETDPLSTLSITAPSAGWCCPRLGQRFLVGRGVQVSPPAGGCSALGDTVVKYPRYVKHLPFPFLDMSCRNARLGHKRRAQLGRGPLQQLEHLVHGAHPSWGFLEWWLARHPTASRSAWEGVFWLDETH